MRNDACKEFFRIRECLQSNIGTGDVTIYLYWQFSRSWVRNFTKNYIKSHSFFLICQLSTNYVKLLLLLLSLKEDVFFSLRIYLRSWRRRAKSEVLRRLASGLITPLSRGRWVTSRLEKSRSRQTIRVLSVPRCFFYCPFVKRCVFICLPFGAIK